MMVIEITEDKFGSFMKNIACIEDKLMEIKEVFEHEAVGHRRGNRYPYEDMEYRGHERREPYNRYM